MKEKSIIVILFALFFFINARSINADIVTYSDDNVSFEYDDSTHARITIDSGKRYNISTKVFDNHIYAPFVMIQASPSEDLKEMMEPANDTIKSVTLISQSPYETAVEFTDGRIGLRKVFETYNNENLIVYFTYPETSSEEYKFCKRIYDSIKASTSFTEQGFSIVSDEYTHVVFDNVLYSPDVRPYVEQAINVCNMFLNAQIDENEAEERFKSLKSGMEKCAEQSGYYFDQWIYLPSIVSKYSDGTIIEIRTELEKVLQQIDE